MCDGKIHRLFNNIKNKNCDKKFKFFNKEEYNLQVMSDSFLNDMINKIVYDTNDSNELIKEIAHLLYYEENLYDFICEPIHALHRIYFLKDFNDYLEKVEKAYNLIDDIIGKIDFEKFNKLNIDLINKINSSK